MRDTCTHHNFVYSCGDDVDCHVRTQMYIKGCTVCAHNSLRNLQAQRPSPIFHVSYYIRILRGTPRLAAVGFRQGELVQNDTKVNPTQTTTERRERKILRVRPCDSIITSSYRVYVEIQNETPCVKHVDGVDVVVVVHCSGHVCKRN